MDCIYSSSVYLQTERMGGNVVSKYKYDNAKPILELNKVVTIKIYINTYVYVCLFTRLPHGESACSSH